VGANAYFDGSRVQRTASTWCTWLPCTPTAYVRGRRHPPTRGHGPNTRGGCHDLIGPFLGGAGTPAAKSTGVSCSTGQRFGGRALPKRRRPRERTGCRESKVTLRRAGARPEPVGLGAAVLLLTNGASGMHLFTADQDRLSRADVVCRTRPRTWADRELYLPASASSTLVTTAPAMRHRRLLYGILSGTGAEEAR